MAKANRPKIVTLRPGNGQRITTHVDPARDAAFRRIEARLFSARAALNCVQRAIHHSEAIDADEDVSLADVALVDTMALLDQSNDDLSAFDRDHLSKPRLQGVAS